MKNKIKNAFKKASIASIAFIAGLVVFVGALSVYANWMDTKVETDQIVAQEWNDMATQVKAWRRVSAQDDSNMLLMTTGNVGIGTTTPTAKLEVNGNIIAADPTEDNHLATKAYVDAAAGEGSGTCDGTQLYIKFLQDGPRTVHLTSGYYNTTDVGSRADADAKCNAKYPGYKFCAKADIESASREGCLPIDSSYMYNMGWLWNDDNAGGTCSDFADTSTTTDGFVFLKDANAGFSMNSGITCNRSVALTCCKY